MQILFSILSFEAAAPAITCTNTAASSNRISIRRIDSNLIPLDIYAFRTETDNKEQHHKELSFPPLDKHTLNYYVT